jgi:O-antigen ligase
LIDVSIQNILDNPFFGAYGYIYSPAFQELKQGSQGIIDIVNTYVAVGLSSGLVGLSFFVGSLAAPTIGVFQMLKRSAAINNEFGTLGRAIFASLVSTLVVIFTVSSVGIIPTIYWTLSGIAVAYIGMINRVLKSDFALNESSRENVVRPDSHRTAGSHATL